MTPRQSLSMVELPLALPVIMAGIRTAAVWVIGTATLSTPIGQTSLGNYIFTGLQTQNWVFVLFGCVAAALLGAGGRSTAGADGIRRRQRAAAGASRSAPSASCCLLAASFLPSLARPSADYIVGAKPFSEQYVLAALIQQRLSDSGLSAGRRDGLGSGVIFDALKANEIDVYVEYTGTIWANQMGRSDIKSRDEVLREVTAWLKERHGITVAGGLGFENAYALAMSAQRAKALGVRSIADLARHAPTLTIAGDYEFFGRPEWAAIRSAYGLKFRNERTMQPEFMYPAAEAGEVDVIAGYTSDGRIARHGLVVLDDPRQAIPPYDAIMLAGAEARERSRHARRVAAAGRRHRRDADARGEPARDRGGDVARGRGALALGRDRAALRAEKMIARPDGRAILCSARNRRQLTSSSTIRPGRSR